jgi:hypothetical protein
MQTDVSKLVAFAILRRCLRISTYEVMQNTHYYKSIYMDNRYFLINFDGSFRKPEVRQPVQEINGSTHLYSYANQDQCV